MYVRGGKISIYIPLLKPENGNPTCAKVVAKGSQVLGKVKHIEKI